MTAADPAQAQAAVEAIRGYLLNTAMGDVDLALKIGEGLCPITPNSSLIVTFVDVENEVRISLQPHQPECRHHCSAHCETER